LVLPFAVKERDVFGPAREEFCEQRFPPAAGLMNHSMAMQWHLAPKITYTVISPADMDGRLL